MPGKTIRDFIYLDIERVRSFSAQLFGGLPFERTRLGEHEIGGEGSASGKVPLIVEASGAVNYHYLKSQSETRSLHDYLFAEFFDQLVTDRKIQDLAPIDESQWQESLFRDGTFFYIRSPLKVVDYKANVALLESLPDIETLINKAASSSLTSKRPGTQSMGTNYAGTQRHFGRAEQQQLQSMRPQIKAMSTLMTQFYGDLVRVKVYPYIKNVEKILVGSADRLSFRFPPASLTSQYGAIIDAGWTSVVQVNRGAAHAAGAIVSSSGNQIEDSFEQLVDQFTSISAMTQGTTFPAVAVTPIAIFREIS